MAVSLSSTAGERWRENEGWRENDERRERKEGRKEFCQKTVLLGILVAHQAKAHTNVIPTSCLIPAMTYVYMLHFIPLLSTSCFLTLNLSLLITLYAPPIGLGIVWI